jgi:hypothetical protein
MEFQCLEVRLWLEVVEAVADRAECGAAVGRHVAEKPVWDVEAVVGGLSQGGRDHPVALGWLTGVAPTSPDGGISVTSDTSVSSHICQWVSGDAGGRWLCGSVTVSVTT